MSVHLRWGLATLALVAGSVALTWVIAVRGQSARPNAPASSDEPIHLVIAYSQPLSSGLGPAKIGDKKMFLPDEGLRTPGGRRIELTLVGLNSQDIIERVMNGLLKAHVILPSSDSYLDFADKEWALRTGKPLVGEKATFLYQPFVLAVQRPMAEAMGWPEKDIGWSDVAEIARNGWKAVGHPEWGPLKLLEANSDSHDANLQLIASIARSFQGGANDLSAERLKDPKLAATFKALDSATVWYPTTHRDLGWYETQGLKPPCHMAFVPEHVVIDLNDRYARRKLPPAWVAVYPRGATIVEGVTAAIVQREWVTEVEREAAAVALKRLMDPEVQRKIMARGFRPAQAGAALAAPLDKAWGVNPQAAAERTGMPPVDLALDCQDAWRKACEVPIRPIGGTDEAVRTVDPAAVRKAAATAGKASRLTPLILCVRKAKPTTVFITRPAIRKVIGSGVVVDPRGYVVTNSHVVGEAKEVTIRFLDGAEKTVEAEVVYNEPKEDLALVRIRTAGEYAAVAYSDSDGVEVGEQVVAIGNPYGYTGTVSLGIVSAVGREIPMPDGGSLTQLIQTDASLNPGNSGGPLLNIDGDLIGINVAVRENAQNIGFAIPANRVRQIVAKILAK